MGGPGSGRRPTKPRRKGDTFLRKDAAGHYEHVVITKTQTGKERRAEKLSPRVQAAAGALVSGAAKTIHGAIALAGYAPANGGTVERVREQAIAVLDKHGATIDEAAKAVARGLIAKRLIVTREESIEWPDTDGQLRAADKVFAVNGVGQADRGSSGGITVNVIQMIAPDAPERLIPSIDAAPDADPRVVNQQEQ